MLGAPKGVPFDALIYLLSQSVQGGDMLFIFVNELRQDRYAGISHVRQTRDAFNARVIELAFGNRSPVMA